ncbi:EPIDERMAL PATTERNING FACTOR-like protein 7 [Capsella rubella]|uniref:EPIDERMAL PATTERNING FACTOR-like protein 7 n=1 Tax=Capsella rubella TaxID=81985 RepID=UPI000CD49FA3|nr:EPIDERMAL PATTERNING FACTOR-like protein 7 [Capsella rubella]
MKSVSLFAIVFLHLFVSSNSFQLDLFNYVASGSSIPDCSNACGPCKPCKLVVIISKCSASEACPLVYKCLCKGKYYHVPSLT